MDLSKITTSTLEALVKLTKKRDTIVKELKRLEAAITGAYSGRKSEPAAWPAKKRPRSSSGASGCHSRGQAEPNSSGWWPTWSAQSAHPRGFADCRRQRCRCERAFFEAWCEESKCSCLVQQHRQETRNDPADWSRTLSAQTGRVSSLPPRNSSGASRIVRQVP